MGDVRQVNQSDLDKVIFLGGDTLAYILKAVNEFNNLEFKYGAQYERPKLIRGEGNTIFEFPANVVGGMAEHPFKLVKVSNDKVRVVNGFVNGQPARMNGVLNQTTPHQTLTVSETGFVYLAVEFVDMDSYTEVSGVDILVGETIPIATSLMAYYVIGEVVITDGVLSIYQNIKGSLFCLRSHCDPQTVPIYVFQGV